MRRKNLISYMPHTDHFFVSMLVFSFLYTQDREKYSHLFLSPKYQEGENKKHRSLQEVGGGAVWKAVFPLLRFGVENPYNTHHYTFRKRFLVCFLIGNSVIVTQFLCLLPSPSFLLLKCDWLICQGRLEKSLASHNTEPVSRASLQF